MLVNRQFVSDSRNASGALSLSSTSEESARLCNNKLQRRVAQQPAPRPARTPSARSVANSGAKWRVELEVLVGREAGRQVPQQPGQLVRRQAPYHWRRHSPREMPATTSASVGAWPRAKAKARARAG